VRGCGLGTSCSSGNDLAPPAPADGFQIVTPPGAFTVDPNQETVPNYCAVVPVTSEFDVGTIQSWMTPGSSHELMVYRSAAPASGAASGGCPLGAMTLMYMSSIAGELVELKMPDGVGIPLHVGEEIVIAMHFVNGGSAPTSPQVKVNFLRAAKYEYEAAALPSFNTTIDVPAATTAGPGTQTVQGTCTAPAGSHFFAIGTHTYSHATAADVSFESHGTTTSVVHSTDWQHPDVALWSSAPFLTLGAGESLAYSCSYTNRGAAPVTVGATESGNDVCMMMGYYFPAGAASCQ
jgi:hypothetical protein